MNSIAQNKRYCPHQITTREHSVKLYRQTKDIEFVCRRYHISKASLMRWNKRYDGTRESLADKSHRPQSKHPNAHTEEECKWIKNYHRRNPNICFPIKNCNADKLPLVGGRLSALFISLGLPQLLTKSHKKEPKGGRLSVPHALTRDITRLLMPPASVCGDISCFRYFTS